MSDEPTDFSFRPAEDRYEKDQGGRLVRIGPLVGKQTTTGRYRPGIIGPDRPLDSGREGTVHSGEEPVGGPP